MARALVLAAMPALSAALMRGTVYQRAAEQYLSVAMPGWIARRGEAVAARAAANLRRINAATVLTPYGLELWMREYPLVGIPRLTPPEANDNTKTPRRRRHVWDWLCRLRPASKA
jgi:hypothetical protein